jgi:hypothetical protein
LNSRKKFWVGRWKPHEARSLAVQHPSSVILEEKLLACIRKKLERERKRLEDAANILQIADFKPASKGVRVSKKSPYSGPFHLFLWI